VGFVSEIHHLLTYATLICIGVIFWSEILKLWDILEQIKHHQWHHDLKEVHDISWDRYVHNRQVKRKLQRINHRNQMNQRFPKYSIHKHLNNKNYYQTRLSSLRSLINLNHHICFLNLLWNSMCHDSGIRAQSMVRLVDLAEELLVWVDVNE